MDDGARSIPAAVVAEEPKRHFFFVELITRLVKEKPLGTVGAIIVLLLLITAILADFLAPYGYNERVGANILSPPSAQHILGTDNIGRDLFSRIIYGARVSMVTGISAAALLVLIASVIGILSGFIGGKFDLSVQRFVDAWMSIPGLVLLLTIISILGPGLLQIIVVIGISSGITGSRIIRSATISIKENMYVEAARAIGSSPMRIMLRHILPNVTAPIIVLFSIRLGSVILLEASLSFLGYGIPPPLPSWGGMLSIGGRSYFEIAPWMAIWPGLALAIAVYGVNMFGDALRDLLDPRLRGGIGRYGRAVTKGRKQSSLLKQD